MERRNKMVKPTAYFIMFVLTFLICELTIRLIFPNRILPLDERNNLYQFDERLGWFPKKNEEVDFEGSRLIKVQHNNYGFRDKEHGFKTKKRILFIGDSFTWGYDVEVGERFTNLLQEKINKWEILNLGVSGYGTDQAFVLLQNRFDQYQPDIVFLTFYNGNDRGENQSKVIYGGYYKPYFLLDNNEIKLEGVPVKKSYRYWFSQYPLLGKSRVIYIICRSIHELFKPDRLEEDPTEAIFIALKKYVESKGSQLVIGLVDGNQLTEETQWCQQHDIQHVLLSNNYKYPSHGNHWTPEGHQFVSKKIFDFLKNNQPQIFSNGDTQ